MPPAVSLHLWVSIYYHGIGIGDFEWWRLLRHVAIVVPRWRAARSAMTDDDDGRRRRVVNLYSSYASHRAFTPPVCDYVNLDRYNIWGRYGMVEWAGSYAGIDNMVDSTVDL